MIARALRRFAGIAAFALAAGCSDGDADTRDLVVWHAYRGAEKSAFETVVADYNARIRDRGYAVRTLAVPFDAFADKLSAAVPRGRGPDVFIFAQERVGGWVEAGRTLEPLDFYLEPDDRDDYLPGLLEALEYRGQTYGLPFNFKSIALIYNTDLVPEPPKTSGELVTIAKALTDTADGRFGFLYAYDDYFFHATLQNGFGGGVFDDEGRLQLDHPGNAAAAKLLLKWRNVDKILPGDLTGSLIASLYNQGRVGMVFSGPWFFGELDPSIPTRVAVLPTLDEADGAPLRPWLTVEALFVAAGSARTRDAYDLARYLSGPQAGAVMTKQGGQLHAHRAVYDDPAIANDPIKAAFKAQLETAEPAANIPDMTLVWVPGERALKLTIKGGASPEAALAEAQKDVAAAIETLRRER